MNFKTRETSFCLKDKNQFRDEEITTALKAQGFPGAQVKAKPA